MKVSSIFAAVAVVAVMAAPASAQDMRGHDNGTGGAGATGAGMLGGTPSMNETPSRTAIRLIHHEKYAEAIPYAEQALADRPNNASALSIAGYAYGMSGDYSTALGYFQKAFAQEPDHRQAHEYLGEVYLFEHNVNGANAQLAELTRICSSGCDEKDELAKRIADYQAKMASIPPATTPH